MTMITPIPSTATLAKIPSPTSLLQSIFSSIGLCRVLEEKHFDACTALSGSGPAFASLVLEAMADGGVMMGLPRKEATELAAQTMQGAARMVLTGLHPAQLKDSVTSEAPSSLPDWRLRSSSGDSIGDERPKLKLFLLFCLLSPLSAPGGCTIAGLLTLEDGKVRSTMARAIQVAAQQSVPCSLSHPLVSHLSSVY
jgi:pyrroline-5-carboxylate reductase